MESLQVITLGCSKNTVDTEHLLGALEGLYDIVPQGEQRQKIDNLIINTCGFIGDAKQESIDAVLEAVRLKSEGKVGKLTVVGCLSQRYMDSLPGLIPEVDSWFGARDFSRVARAFGAKGVVQSERFSSGAGHYAYLKISEGCNRHCSYCAIPLIRGKHVSVPIPELVSEAEALARRGVKELIIIAQDSTFYGIDLYGKRTLRRLLGELSQIEGIEWIRLHYAYPTGFPMDVLDEMASNPKICKYLDIPLQHIDDKVLLLCEGILPELPQGL